MSFLTTNYYISTSHEVHRLLDYVRRKNGDVYFKHVNDHCNELEVITKRHFESLSGVSERELLKDLEGVIKKADGMYLYIKEINAIRRLRNELFMSVEPNRGNILSIPRDVIEHHILKYTTPKQIAELRAINRLFRAAGTHLAKILSINEGGLALKKCLPKHIAKTSEENDRTPMPCLGRNLSSYLSSFRLASASDAISWLKKDLNACQTLKCANFDDYYTFDDSHLKELFQICPNINYLSIRGTYITKIENLPVSLIALDCSRCLILTTLPTLPPSLKKLNCSNCTLLTTIPSLPESLRELDWHNCPKLINPPELPKDFFSEDTPAFLREPSKISYLLGRTNPHGDWGNNYGNNWGNNWFDSLSVDIDPYEYWWVRHVRRLDNPK